MRKKMNKKIAACGALSAALLLAGCANDGTAYRSDVYWAGQVNQAQEVKTVQIIAVMPARVTVDNRRDRSDSATMGTILGALAGAAVGAVVSDSPDAERGEGRVHHDKKCPVPSAPPDFFPRTKLAECHAMDAQRACSARQSQLNRV